MSKQNIKNMATKIGKTETIQILNIKGSCIIGHGLSFGGTRWEIFQGTQRKYSKIVDGRVVVGLFRSGILKEKTKGEFQL